LLYKSQDCYDGALSDPVPVEKTFSLGCDRVVLILTKPRDTIRTSKKDDVLAAGIRKQFPEARSVFTPGQKDTTGVLQEQKNWRKKAVFSLLHRKTQNASIH
jgi:predicted patatin/cPLA2 family phospholipase